MILDDLDENREYKEEELIEMGLISPDKPKRRQRTWPYTDEMIQRMIACLITEQDVFDATKEKVEPFYIENDYQRAIYKAARGYCERYGNLPKR